MPPTRSAMFDKNLYLKNIVSNWGAFLVSIAVGFFLSPVIVRELGDARYGFWSLVVAFTAYFGYLDLGLQSAVGQYVSRHAHDGDAGQLQAKADTALTVLAGLGFLAILSVLIASFAFPRFFHVEAGAVPSARAALLLMGVAMALKLPLSVFSAVLAGAQRFYVISGVSMAIKLFNAALIVLVLKTHQGLLAFALTVSATQLGEGALLAFFAVRIAPGIRFRLFAFQARAFGELFRYGFFNFLINLFGQGSALFCTFLIGHRVAAEAVTYFSIGSELLPYMGAVISAVTLPLLQIVIPMDVRADFRSMEAMLITGTRYLFALVCLISLNLLAVGHDFLAQWMGGKYLEPFPYGSSGTVLSLLTLANAAALSSSVAQQILFGRRKNKLFAVFIAAEASATILLAALLIPRWGIRGVAVAALVPMLVCEGILIPAITCAQVGASLPQYWRRGILPNLILSALVYAVARALLPHVPGLGWGRVFLSFTLVSLLHAAGAYLFLVESAHKRMFISQIRSRLAWGRP